MKLKLILAVSADGYLARGPDDDMRWTGRDDKGIFKLLTTMSPQKPLLAGRVTADALPTLPGRAVVALSRDPLRGMDLRDAACSWPEAWLIGGPTVALEALKLGLVDRAYLCQSEAFLGGGISSQPLKKLLGNTTLFSSKVGCVVVEVFDGINRGA